MARSKKILWIDNDPAYIEPFLMSLEDEGFEVQVAKTVSAGENALASAHEFCLLILDVMIPTVNEAEEKVYLPDETGNGHRTGLIFYKRMKVKLEELGLPVLVMTVRIDKAITMDFIEAGLALDRFVTKMELRDASDFLAKVQSVIEE